MAIFASFVGRFSYITLCGTVLAAILAADPTIEEW